MSARLTDRQRDTLRLMQPVCAYAAWELDDPTPLHLEGMVACGLLVGRWHNGELLYIITPKGRAALRHRVTGAGIMAALDGGDE